MSPGWIIMAEKSVIKMLMEKHKSPVWISKDGSLTPLSIMSDRMLGNCYQRIVKQIEELISPWAMVSPRGEMACDMFDDMLDSGRADDEYSRESFILYDWKEKLQVEFNKRR
jgi:hypothetical protein